MAAKLREPSGPCHQIALAIPGRFGMLDRSGVQLTQRVIAAGGFTMVDLRALYTILGAWMVLATIGCSTRIDPRASAECQQAVEGAREASVAASAPEPDPRTFCETCCVAKGLHNVTGSFCDCGQRGWLRQLLYSH